ncbi:hypothetical protein XELAEV_18033452mg [Xenopus laevis]|uniref:Uncharacterized protein n=1 Tax=Xenopus laevis TaxID=8355 RepID=A0A974CJY8_XENLA|nr:hypothetical protein XELAEV_18033452mg [Xenopus laevis]
MCLFKNCFVLTINNRSLFKQDSEVVLIRLAKKVKDAFVELYNSNIQPPFDQSWLSIKTILSLAVVGACITIGAYLGHK